MVQSSRWDGAGLDHPVVHFESDSSAPVLSEMESRPDGETQADYGHDDGDDEHESVERPKVETDSGQRHARKDHQHDSDEERDSGTGYLFAAFYLFGGDQSRKGRAVTLRSAKIRAKNESGRFFSGRHAFCTVNPIRANTHLASN